jgi:PTH2 family peptidyl-tRNA hydrolase
LKVKDETELLALESKARNSGINTCLIKDAGKTEVEAGTPTVVAIGPCKLLIYSFFQNVRDFRGN